MNARTVTLLGYVAFATAPVVLQVLALRPGSAIPTLGALVRRATHSRPWRLGLIAAWAWVGLHLFVR